MAGLTGFTIGIVCRAVWSSISLVISSETVNISASRPCSSRSESQPHEWPRGMTSLHAVCELVWVGWYLKESRRRAPAPKVSRCRQSFSPS